MRVVAACYFVSLPFSGFDLLMLAALLKHGLPTARKLVGMWGSDLCWTASLYQPDHETHSCGIQSGRGWLRVFDHQRMQVVHHPVLVDCCQGWLSRLLERPKLFAKAVTGICGYGLTPKMMQMSMNLLLFSHIPINFPLSWHRNISQFCNFLRQLAMLESTNKTFSYFFSIPVQDVSATPN